MNYIDLFSGAGGFSLGFDVEGFNNIFSIDKEKNFCDTYKFNFPNHTLLEMDIKELNDELIDKLIKKNKIDVIIGGPPCQGFSMAGNPGRKFIDDERNHLFKEFARIVEKIKPTYFVMENVSRLYNHNKGKTRKEIINIFESMGYKVECKILNSNDYNVPQIRKRIIFIGSLNNDNIIFPDKIKNNNLTIKNAIDKYPPLLSGEKSDIPNHIAMNHTEQMLYKMKYVKDGGDRKDIPIEYRPTSGDIRKYIKYNSQKPSICITGDMRKVFHYNQNRALTVRELAAIQTFPDNFIFKGTSLSKQQQVGNSVPPEMARCIAKSIKKMILINNE